MSAALARWYRAHGRHDLPWRASRDRWRVLVSEVMLHQTQVPRVAAVWDAFIARFPTPDAMAAAGPGAVIEAWGRLGYPRRALRLWESSVQIADDGWPDDLTTLPGVGRYTAAAIRAQADDAPDAIGTEVNIHRVCERVAGDACTPKQAEPVAVRIAKPLVGRDRLLALMDLGATVCTARAPRCDECPIRDLCETCGVRADETRRRQPRFEGSFRQRRGIVMAKLRAGSTPTIELDGEALASLLDDGLAEVTRGRAHLPRLRGSSPGGRGPRR